MCFLIGVEFTLQCVDVIAVGWVLGTEYGLEKVALANPKNSPQWELSIIITNC